MDQHHQLRFNPYVVTAAIALLAGILIGVASSPATATSSSCRDLVSLDNQVFTKTANVLGDVTEMEAMSQFTAFVNQSTPQRQALVKSCLQAGDA